MLITHRHLLKEFLVMHFSKKKIKLKEGGHNKSSDDESIKTSALMWEGKPKLQ